MSEKSLLPLARVRSHFENEAINRSTDGDRAVVYGRKPLRVGDGEDSP